MSCRAEAELYCKFLEQRYNYNEDVERLTKHLEDMRKEMLAYWREYREKK